MKRFGKCRRKQWKDNENMEEMYVELWNDLEYERSTLIYRMHKMHYWPSYLW